MVSFLRPGASLTGWCCLVVSLLASIWCAAGAEIAACSDQPSIRGSARWHRLKKGAVLVDLNERGGVKFVVARVLIDAPPEEVWRTLTNPFEFERRISPQVQRVEVLYDTPRRSILRYRFHLCFPLPCVSYTVVSRYQPCRHVEFRRLDGVFRDFRGCWSLQPQCRGARTELVYSMYVDPGLAIPQWIVRKAVCMELPRTLNALRSRVERAGTGCGVLTPARSIRAVHATPARHASSSESP